MSKKFIIDGKFRSLIDLHRHDCRSKRQKLRRFDGEDLYNDLVIIYNEFSKYLPSSVSNVLDVGCGLGYIDVVINDNLNDCNFYMFDAMNTVNVTQVRDFYSNLKLTKKFMVEHGVDADSIFLVDASKTGMDRSINKDPKCFSSIPKMDLVVSMYSWGWHFPLEKYIKEVSDITSKDGLLVLECKNQSGPISTADREVVLNSNGFDLIDVAGEERRHRIIARRL